MTTYTLQTHQPSGETHILQYDADDTIIAVSEAIDWRTVDALRQHPRMLRYAAVNAEDAIWARAQQWSAPVAEWQEAAS